jgi:hypothetical protein
MNREGSEAGAVVVGLAFLGVLAWSMTSVSYDIWGAMILAPLYGLVGVALLRRMFRYELRPVAVALSWGLLLKLGGAFARYWVGFEAYGGAIDAGRYHQYAGAKANEIWAGSVDAFDVLPAGTGTEFVENLTAVVFALTGTSLLGGFVTFSFLAFIGVALFVKAASVAIPGLAVRRYAWLCAFFPSLVYWPSSIGKEALIILGTGVATYGVALLVTQRQRFGALMLISIGLGFTAIVRPHIAGLWLAAVLPAIVLAVVRGRRASAESSSRFAMLIVLAIASVCFVGLAAFTLRFLGDITDDSGANSLTTILDETQRRTSEANSTFVPPSISSPANWPFAAIRTLVRPLPFEARGFAQLLAAGEIMLLAGAYLYWWRSVVRIPRLLLKVPYVLFALGVVFLGGLVFASLANTGILTRQKSLLFPLLLVLPCLPIQLPRMARPRDGNDGVEARHGADVGGEVSSGVDTVPARVGLAPSRSTKAMSEDELDEFWREEVR